MRRTGAPSRALRDADEDINQELLQKFPGGAGGTVYRWNDSLGGERRDMSVTLGTAAIHGSATIGNEVPEIGQSIRDSMVLAGLGVRFIGGLKANATLPYGTAQVSGEWLGEGAGPSEESEIVNALNLEPHRLCAVVPVTRQLYEQGGPMFNAWLTAELTAALGIELERAAIAGSGAGSQPSGLLKITGAGSVVGGVSGAAPTYANIVDLEAAVKISGGRFGFLTSRKARQKLRKTFINGTGSAPVWGESGLLGRPSAVSDIVPDTLTKGSSGAVCSAIIAADFSELFILTWGPGIAVEVTTDAAHGAQGRLVVVASVFADVGFRIPSAAALMVDAIC